MLSPLNVRKPCASKLTIGFGFTSNWLRKRRDIFEPISERNKEKVKKYQITFDTQVKTALKDDNAIVGEKKKKKQWVGVNAELLCPA